MRNLKYLQLFEAFESTKLSKTLGYVDKRSRQSLLDALKRICNRIDFPFSELSDDYFKYLPYNKALNVQYIGEQKPCQATSKSQFDSSGIEGESCQSGKIKRMWGQRQRIVDCPNCSGTGIQPERAEVKILKFWFSKEGEIVATTGIDNVSKPSYKKSIKFSRKLSDYTPVGEPRRRRSDTSDLEKGDIVWAQLQNGSDPEVCYVWKERRRVYLLQDKFDGDSPNDGDWKEIADLSWNISDGDFITLTKLQPKNSIIEETEPEINPFSFNKLVSLSGRGDISIDRYSGSTHAEKAVSKADFALIFDISKLKESPFKGKREISQERQELKSGSKLVVKDEDIKMANIERYMTEIAKRSDIISDISNLRKVVKRILTDNSLYLIIYNSRFTNNISTLVDKYLRALKEDASENYWKRELSNYIAEKYKSMAERNNNVSRNLKEVRDHLQKNNLEGRLQIIDGLDKMSKLFNNIINNSKLECIEDVEILLSKLDGLRSIFRGNRYEVDKLDYFIDSLTNDDSKSSIRYITDHYYVRDYIGEINDSIQKCLTILSRY